MQLSKKKLQRRTYFYLVSHIEGIQIEDFLVSLKMKFELNFWEYL
jgi:hypothetical protein